MLKEASIFDGERRVCSAADALTRSGGVVVVREGTRREGIFSGSARYVAWWDEDNMKDKRRVWKYGRHSALTYSG